MPRTPPFIGLAAALLAGSLLPGPARLAADAPPPEGVYTYHGDNMRTGWYRHEMLLTQANVNTAQFGRLWASPVEGQIYAQPLYAPGVPVGSAGTRDLVIVATEHNSVAAFDAGSGALLWQVNLGPSVPNGTTGVACGDIEGPEYGITGTPVLDPATGTLFVVAKTLQGGQQHYDLHALQIGTGQEQPGWPAAIEGAVAGNGGASVGGRIMFDARIQHQRPGLLLLNGHVIIGFGSHCDHEILRYHGWVFSFNAADPRELPQVFNTTPDQSAGPFAESAGAVWQSGFGLAADDTGDVFFETGNGLFNADLGGRNVGDSFVRLTTAGGTLSFDPNPQNFFTASNERLLDSRDLDQGSGGAMVIPDQPGSTTPHLLIGCGKDGVIRLLNRDFLGGHTGRNHPTAKDNAIQDVPGIGGAWCGPAYWEGPAGPAIFFTGSNNRLRSFRLRADLSQGGKSVLVPAASNSTLYKQPSPTPVVSSNGSAAGTGIVWLLRRDDNSLRAFNAENLTPLWQSNQTAADNLGGQVVKFTVPVVANGRVYAGMKTDHGFLVCYGPRG